jgi:dihydrofolate reductase
MKLRYTRLESKPDSLNHAEIVLAKLIYMATASLDGFVEDRHGKFDWGAPSHDVLGFINDNVRPVGTFLFGRRMYETMLYWETVQMPADAPAVATDFLQIWQNADKIVYSRTLSSVSSARTRLEGDFDVDAVRTMKSAAGRDINVGGSTLAAQAIAAGLIDEFRLYVVPTILGGGKRCLPDDVRLHLTLLEVRGFENGTVFLRYGPGGAPG